jgi:hypothetical protein
MYDQDTKNSDIVVKQIEELYSMKQVQMKENLKYIKEFMDFYMIITENWLVRTQIVIVLPVGTVVFIVIRLLSYKQPLFYYE